MNWILTIYDVNDNVIEELVIFDRTEKEAGSESESYVENAYPHGPHYDWTLIEATPEQIKGLSEL
jgi:hypothetical protein